MVADKKKSFRSDYLIRCVRLDAMIDAIRRRTARMNQLHVQLRYDNVAAEPPEFRSSTRPNWQLNCTNLIIPSRLGPVQRRLLDWPRVRVQAALDWDLAFVSDVDRRQVFLQGQKYCPQTLHLRP